ncbi:hypothetical protein SAMN05216252_1575 [Actinacidiphila glaucinigra]|uniref:HTH marR-type domain-containing protein n=2 Tax=Actinacidiphila glaucinigra TaxID=235986 RepID=A0A239NZ26_9ACTN|nr:hypothetical protein SAMN05216252_1575 [Actinacidiphila glaucinigra]
MRIVDEPVRRGLAVRRPVPGDRRARAVKVTPQGAGVADAAHAAAGELAERMVTEMSPGERAQFGDLLMRVARPASGTT